MLHCKHWVKNCYKRAAAPSMPTQPTEGPVHGRAPAPAPQSRHKAPAWQRSAANPRHPCCGWAAHSECEHWGCHPNPYIHPLPTSTRPSPPIPATGSTERTQTHRQLLEEAVNMHQDLTVNMKRKGISYGVRNVIPQPHTWAVLQAAGWALPATSVSAAGPLRLHCSRELHHSWSCQRLLPKGCLPSASSQIQSNTARNPKSLTHVCVFVPLLLTLAQLRDDKRHL